MEETKTQEHRPMTEEEWDAALDALAEEARRQPEAR